MGSAESRVYLVHLATGAALVKRGSGDCPCGVEPLNEVLESNDGMWKIECYCTDRNKRPSLIYIRNDWHPQRALNEAGNLVDCSMRGSRDDELWYVEYPEDSKEKIFAIKNKSSGKYLTLHSDGQKYNLSFQSDRCYWFACLAKHAPSPGQVATLCAVAPIAAVVSAISGGAAGVAIAGAVEWGNTVMLSVGAAAGALSSISGAIAKVAMDPASNDWVVMKV